MTWHVGDLGRLTGDPYTKPTFEFLGTKNGKAAIIRQGQEQPQWIPLEALKNGCSQDWKMQGTVKRPEWYQKGRKVRLVLKADLVVKSSLEIICYDAEGTPIPNPDLVRSKPVATLRSLYKDHLSCSIQGSLQIYRLNSIYYAEPVALLWYDHLRGLT